MPYRTDKPVGSSEVGLREELVTRATHKEIGPAGGHREPLYKVRYSAISSSTENEGPEIIWLSTAGAIAYKEQPKVWALIEATKGRSLAVVRQDATLRNKSTRSKVVETEGVQVAARIASRYWVA